MDQYSQRECVEIRGIPVSKHEDTNKIIVRVGELMGVEIKEDDISVSYRLPTSSKYKLKVKSPYLLLLLSLSDIMLKKDISRAINNSRTIQHVTLAFHSRGVSSWMRAWQKEIKVCSTSLWRRRRIWISYIWTSNGRIYLRKSQDSPVIPINNKDNLKKLYPS